MSEQTTPDLPTQASTSSASSSEAIAKKGRVFQSRRGDWGRGESLPSTSGFQGLQPHLKPSHFVEPPYGGWFDELADRLQVLAPGGFTKVAVHRGEITFFVPADKILEVVKVLRDDAALRFESCVSLSGVHYPNLVGEELHVVYHLLSITHNRRIRLEVALSEADPRVPSVVSVYPMTNYHEREAWDMFGIIFEGHPALTRILMPDDWIGHPQRKDYPLGGIPIEYKGAVVPPPDQRRRFR